MTRSRTIASSAWNERDEFLALAELSAGFGMWELDLARKSLRGTAQFFRIHGLTPTTEPVPFETKRRLCHPDDRARVERSRNQTLAGGTPYLAIEYRIIRPDGDLRWIFTRGKAVHDDSDRPIRLGSVDVDITDRKVAEAALRESEERFRRVFQQSPLGKVIARADLRFRTVNPALCIMLGYAEDQLVGRRLIDIVHPDDRDVCVALAHARTDDSSPQIGTEGRLLCRSGDVLWVNMRFGPIRDADGNVLCVLGTIENIDEHMRTARAPQESETRLRPLMEKLEQATERAAQLASSQAQLQAFFVNSRDWLTLQRAAIDGRIVYADINPACEAAYGLPREQVVGRTAEEVLGCEAAQVPLHYLHECLRTGQPQRYEARRTMAGRTTTIDVMFVLVPGTTERGERFIITAARDITEHEQLETQLRHAQKMEAVGQLTGGVAHDFNNLLAIIGGNAELARRRPTGGTARYIDNILRATQRGAALTKQLLSFSRRHVGISQIIDLRTEMPRVAEMLRASLRGNIRMHVEVAEQIWPVEADLAELEMALVNVAMNARDAMPRGGMFGIDVRNVAKGSSALHSEHVAIALSDSGVGIPPELVGKVFDPFFTTKEHGEGTGLGLSQVYGFAQQSGGVVSIDSERGRGTTITIRLPRSYRPMPAVVGHDDSSRSARASGCVLVVEDNPQVADVTAQMLRAMGFRVEVADRARKALERLEAGTGGIDLLLTDVVMPDGLNGIDLATRVRERFPALPIILTSGYNDAVAPAGSAFPLLRKTGSIFGAEPSGLRLSRARSE
jgi:PAS domain S-box-containing protein